MGRKIKTVSFLVLGWWILRTEAVSVGNGNGSTYEESLTLNTNASPSPSITSSESIPCSFTIENFKYDLCPLLQSSTRHMKLTMSEETPPTLTRKTYEISLEGALKRDGTLPAELQCPDGTWICLTVANTRPNHPLEPTRILQVVPIAGSSSITHIAPTTEQKSTTEAQALVPKFKLLRSNNEKNGGGNSEGDVSLRMTLHGGKYTGQHQKAAFLFECDRSREKAEKMSGISSSPKFVWSFNGTHTFEWKSVYACPDALVSQPPSSPPPKNPTNGGDEEENVDPPPTDDESEGSLPPIIPVKGKEDSRLIFGPYSVFWAPSLLLVLYFLVSRKLLPVSVRRFWTSSSSPVRWRAFGYRYRYRSLGGDRDSVLPRDDDDDDGEGWPRRRGYEVNEEVFSHGEFEGEEIPLTPSPRKETFGYGALR